MLDPALIQYLTVLGAAGAFFLMLKWIADGKFHTDSEVEGLREDKRVLLEVNARQAKALESSNKLHEKAYDTISILRQRLGDPVARKDNETL